MERSSGRRPFLMEGLLLLATLFWGVSFIWCADITATGVDASAYVAIRNALASALMLPVFWKDVRQATKKDLLRCAVMGLIYYLAYASQVWGMEHTTPANASFITAAYVVLVPVTAWLILKQRAEKTIFLSLTLCVAGLYVLNMAPGEGLQMNVGNLITLGCAVCWAFQVTFTSYAGRTVKPNVLTVLSLMFCSLIAAAAALFTGGFDMTGLPVGRLSWLILLMALFPTIGSGLCQAYAQKSVPPSRAAVIFTLESVIACALSVILGYDAPSVRLFLGGGLIVSAILIAEVRLPGKKHKEEVTNGTC